MARNDPRPLPVLSQKDIERFWTKVDKTPGQGPNGTCWIWTAYRTATGYGSIQIQKPRGSFVASRIAYFLATGSDPGPLHVLHKCDNPPCVNPADLFLGTAKDNQHDMIRKGRGRYTGPKNPARGERHGTHTRPDRLARGDRNGSHTHPERVPRGDRSGSRLHPERLRPCRGETNGMSKLTDAAVREIRAKYATGNYSQQHLAIEYACSFSLIGMIVRRDRWKHII